MIQVFTWIDSSLRIRPPEITVWSALVSVACLLHRLRRAVFSQKLLFIFSMILHIQINL